MDSLSNGNKEDYWLVNIIVYNFIQISIWIKLLIRRFIMSSENQFKARSVNEDKDLWTELFDQVETLENRDEMACINLCCWNCCFQI